MSTTTLVFFIISAATFAVLLVLAIVLYLRNRSSAPSIAKEDVSNIAKKAYTCDVEIVVLEDTIQITNLEEKPMCLKGTNVEQGIELIPNDQWVKKLDEGQNTYRMFASSVDDQFEQIALEVKITATEVAVRPVIKTETLQVMIWKLKPILLSSNKHLVERQVFSGRLQKTVNFDRMSGKYYRIRVATDSCKTTKPPLESKSNIGSCEHHQLLTVRIEPNKVVASNVSNRRMMVVVGLPNSQSTLKRKLEEEEIQEMPLNGTFSFSIQPGKSEEAKDLLCLEVSEQNVIIEPHTKFGTVPLICDVRSPGKAPGDSFSQIIFGEIMSQLQLPRKSYSYVLVFYMRVATSEAETSYTLQ